MINIKAHIFTDVTILCIIVLCMKVITIRIKMNNKENIFGYLNGLVIIHL